MNTILLSIYMYHILGFLNVMILDATDPHQAHASVSSLLWRHLVLWPHSMWHLVLDLITNWNTPCDSH